MAGRRGSLGGGVKPGTPASKDGFKVPKLPKKKDKPRGTAGARIKAGAICGAKKRGGGRCTLAPGWGTNHPGFGSCKFHGGTAPTHVMGAAQDELRKLLGRPIEINPYDAILWCIKIRAGEVKWLGEEMAKLKPENYVEVDGFGMQQFHLYARERQQAMRDLTRFSHMAISLGIAEKAVRLGEVYADSIARLIRGIMEELDPYILPEGKELIPQIVRRHLILLEGGKDPGPVAPRADLELEAAEVA